MYQRTRTMSHLWLKVSISCVIEEPPFLCCYCVCLYESVTKLRGLSYPSQKCVCYDDPWTPTSHSIKKKYLTNETSSVVDLLTCCRTPSNKCGLFSHILIFRCENPKSSLISVQPIFLETAFLNFQTIREMKIDNKKLGGKIGFLSFYSVCMFFVCLFVFVCLSVIARQTASFNIGVWHFNIDTYMKISKNGIFY